MKTHYQTLCFIFMLIQLIAPLAAETELKVNIFGNDISKEVISYSDQDKDGTASIEDNGLTLRLNGNTWKAIDLSSIDLTADSVLEFEFSSSLIGEIHAIAFLKTSTYMTITALDFMAHRAGA